MYRKRTDSIRSSNGRNIFLSFFFLALPFRRSPCPLDDIFRRYASSVMAAAAAVALWCGGEIRTIIIERRTVNTERATYRDRSRPEWWGA